MKPARHLNKTYLISIVILALVFSSCQQAQNQIASQSGMVIPFSQASPSFTITLPPTDIPVTPTPVMWAYKDIPYFNSKWIDPKLVSLDIYTPVSRRPHPIIVMIHGGAWRGGDKNTPGVSGTKSLFFTSKDYIFVSINYQLSPEVIHPTHVKDVTEALVWIINNIQAYGGDPQQVYVMGHSSGGQLAALVATDERYLAVYGMKPNILRGVILLEAAGLDIPATMSPSSAFMYETAFGTDPTVWADASPINHVASGKGTPPFLVCISGQISEWTGTGQQFVTKLSAAGIPAQLVVDLDKTHNSINDDIGTPSDLVTGDILAFIKANAPLVRPGQPVRR
jgi:arylformamidase